MSQSQENTPLALHLIALIILWIVVCGALSAMLLLDVRSTGHYRTLRYALQAGYVVALLWYLSRAGPSVNQLP